METIQTKQDLQSAILQLEKKQLLEKNSIQQYFQESYNYIKPANLLKTTISEITHADQLRKDMLKAAIALAIGFIARKIIETYVIKSRTPLAIALESIIQIVISGIVAKNGNIFKEIALYFFRTILQHKQKQISATTTN